MRPLSFPYGWELHPFAHLIHLAEQGAQALLPSLMFVAQLMIFILQAAILFTQIVQLHFQQGDVVDSGLNFGF